MFLLLQAYLYIRHLLLAQSKYYIHSPFVYKFYQHVISSKAAIDNTRVNLLREELLRDKRKIDFREYGAGSKIEEQSKNQPLHTHTRLRHTSY